MLISLILATKERTVALERYLASLEMQTYFNFEVILIDQNSDDRLKTIIDRYSKKFRIISVKSLPGLSRARNIGLKLIKGDVIAFPDDDCWYFSDTLEVVAKIFLENADIMGITGIVIDENNTPFLRKIDKHDGWINRNNVWRRGTSISIFLRQSVVEKIGEFDENLGVGAGTAWLSGEESDYLIRIIDSGFFVRFISSIKIGHENPEKFLGLEVFEQRAYSYAPGLGYVLKKHKFSHKHIMTVLLRPLIGMMFYFFIGRFDKAKCYWITVVGRIWGLLTPQINFKGKK